MNRKLIDLERALDQVLSGVQGLGPPAEIQTVASIDEVISSTPPGLARKATESIKAAADIGDVMQVAAIAKELKSEYDVLKPFCDKIIQLSADFDLDGIQKLTDELVAC